MLNILKFYIVCIFFGINFNSYSMGVIKLATSEWSPYIGEDLYSQGLIAKIVQRALEMEGYKLNLVFLPWARAVKEAETGKDNLDGYLPEYFDKSKEEYFEFSDPFLDSEVGFLINEKNKLKFNITIDKNNLQKSYEKLKNYRFGIVRGYVNEEYFDKNTELNKIDSTSDEKNLILLDENKVDIVVIDKNVAHYYKRNSPELLLSKNSFFFISPAIKSHKLYIAWSKSIKNYKDKNILFNNGLKKLIESGEYSKIIKFYQNIH
ncbi:transporter substrate-binding domain-containing protein [Pigmentibacter sp. JX0631]|uniref:substrate-binding periplasmic protein n=1 Tax=Pigmentibacter sp. JX0631 TaxID=2976982 RepID=UPI00246853DB|nr:transporter substrate-binding domain-containing protein [Pigmentibacter sp. JX0631]WGL59821.1 transporter substrate-binding domain-containing protein [Pigmentibacter sp. JX0631]